MQNKIAADAVGVEVSWSFGFGDAEAVTIPRAAVRDAFARLGYPADELVPDMDADDALRRAARYAPATRTISVKEFARPNKDTPRSYGVYVRQDSGQVSEAGDGWACGARVRVEAKQVACLPPEGGDWIAEARKVAEGMAKQANALLENAQNLDLSEALTKVGDDAGWIPRRRNQGGVWMLGCTGGVGRDRAERFVALLDALHALTADESRGRQFIPQVQEMFPRPLTMNTWAGSARDHVEGELGRLSSELDRMLDDGVMRDKTKAARADECDRMIQLAEDYRLFLGTAVDELSTRLKAVRDRFTGAIGQNLQATLDAVEAAPEPAAEAPATRKRGRVPVNALDIFEELGV